MPKKIVPITPQDAQSAQPMPMIVIEAFNDLIKKNYHGGEAVILQDAVVNLIVLLGRGSVKRSDIFENRWLDVEGVFHQAGWDVAHDKPGYGEDSAATFTFRPRA